MRYRYLGFSQIFDVYMRNLENLSLRATENKATFIRHFFLFFFLTSAHFTTLPKTKSPETNVFVRRHLSGNMRKSHNLSCYSLALAKWGIKCQTLRLCELTCINYPTPRLDIAKRRLKFAMFSANT